MTTFDASAHSTEFPLAALRNLKERMGDWFLIGAFARDLVVNCAAGLPRGSETFDVDIAIAVANDDQYRARVAALGKEGGSRIRYRTDGFAVDVIAYGGIAPGNQFDDEGTTLDVTGMAEARACAVEVILDDDLRIWCASLHAQVLLKTVAWQARKGATTKDARDLGSLIEAAHNGIYEAEVWADEEALDVCGYLPDLAGAYRIGRLIADDFEPSSVERAREALSGKGLVQIADEAAHWGLQRAVVAERLDALRRGLAD